MIMSIQMKKYKDSLLNISEPINLSQITEKVDLRGLMEYAQDKGVKVAQLSEDEKMMFMSNRLKEAK